MLMTVYAPVLNTTAARLYVDRDRVIFLNDVQATAWEGKPSDLAGSLAAFGNSELPMLLLGLPATGVNDMSFGPAGLQGVQLGDVAVSYQPAVYPPKVVAIDRGAQHVEIEHLESFVDPEAVQAPPIPNDYRCCVLPQV